MDWTQFGIRFILALHAFAGVATLVGAYRDRLSHLESFQWGAIGFITGFVGLLTRARMDRRHVNYVRIIQDALVNVFLEGAIFFGMPYFFR